MAETPLLRPLTLTGKLLLVVVPLPSSRYPLSPHATAAPFCIANENICPAATAVTPPLRPFTATGTLLFVLVPLPSWPEPLYPHAQAMSAIASEGVVTMQMMSAARRARKRNTIAARSRDEM